jgi:hypothetical protein
MVTAADSVARNTRGRCDTPVSKTLRFAELRLAGSCRECHDARDAPQAEAAEL